LFLEIETNKYIENPKNREIEKEREKGKNVGRRGKR
jgi:hypothetical protein